MSNDDFSDQPVTETPKTEKPMADTSAEDRVSDKVRNILNLIKSGKPTQQGYRNLWDNTLKYKHITEYERELVIAALEPVMKLMSSKNACAAQGSKDFEIKELLAKLLMKVSSHYPLDENCVRQGVKTGGAMISGEKYVAAYFSYKSKEKWHVVFEIQQESAKDAFYIIVKKYLGGEENLDGKIYEEFSNNDIDTALARYCEHLEFIFEESRNAAV